MLALLVLSLLLVLGRGLTAMSQMHLLGAAPDRLLEATLSSRGVREGEVEALTGTDALVKTSETLLEHLEQIR